MAADDYETINCRTILIPDLGLPFRVITVEPSEEVRSAIGSMDPELPGGPKDDSLDKVLVNELCSIFGVPALDVMSFSRWATITNAVDDLFQDQSFKGEMEEAYGVTNLRLAGSCDLGSQQIRRVSRNGDTNLAM